MGQRGNDTLKRRPRGSCEGNDIYWTAVANFYTGPEHGTRQQYASEWLDPWHRRGVGNKPFLACS